MGKRKVALVFFGILLISLLSVFPAFAALAPGDPATVPDELKINWNDRQTFSEIEGLLTNITAAYPEYTKKYTIGTTYQERNLWCLEITNKNISNSQKTGIGIFGNIHGGEQESAESALYTAWWLLLNSNTQYVENILDNYVIYVVPLINPDGYVQSFVTNTRQNLRPTDRNSNNIPFSDPYTDINGDGAIATIYKGTAASHGTKIGVESPDWDNNGVLGDDPRASTIDLNRTFDYQWNRYDIETYKTPDTDVIGANAWSSAGPAAASEPEIKAVQDFLAAKPMNALVTLHTGIQCVLWPWCYRPYEADNSLDQEIPFMATTGTAMAQAFSDSSGRPFYARSSYTDYPTAAEMIDYAYGMFNIHAYTIEVYQAGNGKPDASDVADRDAWGNADQLAQYPVKWQFYSQADLLNNQMLSSSTIDKLNLAPDEGLWFSTSTSAQMAGIAPVDQEAMVKGCKDAIMVMIESEPYGKGYSPPPYIHGKVPYSVKTASTNTGSGSSGGHRSSSATIATPKPLVKNFDNDNKIVLQGKDLQNATGLTLNGKITLELNENAVAFLSGDQEVVLSYQLADNSALSSSAKTLIGSRPVYEISLTKGGNKVTSVGDGSIKFTIPYDLQNGEDKGKLYAYNIDASGNVQKIPGSVYNAADKAMVLSCSYFYQVGIGYQKNSFVDVDGWYSEYVNYLADKGIINGRSEYEFAPSENITRGEFVAILMRMSQANTEGDGSSSFKDVSSSAWYAPYVAWAAEKGIAKGYEGNFQPEAKISRQEMAVMIGRYAENIAKYTLPKTNQALMFADNSSIASYARDAVSMMQQAGVISGKSNNIFAPQDNATRAEASKMIAVLMQQMEQ